MATAATVQITEPNRTTLTRVFTEVPTDWFILVVRGGDAVKIIEAVKGWYADEDLIFRPETEDRRAKISPIRALLGYEFVGIPPFQRILAYQFTWNKYWRDTDKTGKQIAEYSIVPHDPHFIYMTPFWASYPLMFGGVEVKDEEVEMGNKKKKPLIPITISINTRVRMIRPVTAIMSNTDWFGQVLTPTIQQALKEFAGTKTYENFVVDARDKLSEEFSKEFMSGNGRYHSFHDQILEDAGVEIVNIGITDIKGHEEYEKGLRDLAISKAQKEKKIVDAEGDKDAEIIRSEGSAKAMNNLSKAEARRLRKTTLATTGGPGAAAAGLEQFRYVRDSKLNTFVNNSGTTPTSILVGPNGRPIEP